MYSKIPAPEGRLSKNAVKVWIMTETVTHVVAFIVLTILYYLSTYFSWKEWIEWIIFGVASLTTLSAIWAIFINPFLLYKNWRYHADEEFLQLKSGAFNEEHQLIPMTKIQAVSSNQGPFLRKYSLYSLSVDTLGTSHEIPALPEDIAIELRNKIAHFAKIKEVEE